MSNPLVSICIPTYNGEKFITQAMQSAINQSYHPLEIIVSDDESFDSTLDIVNLFIAKTNIPIKIINHKSSSIGSNWNSCVAHSNGDYIKFLFQDDLLKNNCIEEMVKLAVSDNEIGLVFSKRNFITEGNSDYFKEWVHQYGDLQSNWTEIQTIQSGKKLLKDINFLSSPKNKVAEPSSVLLAKFVFKKVGYFNTDLKQSLDYEFWYRVFKFYKIGYINHELSTFRLHEQQTTIKNKSVVISDYQDYPKFVYDNLFWQLHPKIKTKLFLKYNFIVRVIRKIISFFN